MSKKLLTFIFLGLTAGGSLAAYIFSDSSGEDNDAMLSAMTSETFVGENQEIDWQAVKKKTDSIVEGIEQDKAYLQTVLENVPSTEEAANFVAPTLPEKIESEPLTPESIDLVEKPELGVPTLNPDAAIQSAVRQTGMSEQEIRELLK